MPGGSGLDANKGQNPLLITLGVPDENPDHSDGGSRTSSRTASLARLLTELTLKVKTQMGRFRMLQEAIFSLPADQNMFSLNELAALTAHVEFHKAFLKDHTYFETTWPSALTEHPYFKDSIHMYGCRAYSTYKQAAARVKEALTLPVQIAVPTHGTTKRTAHLRLPEINLSSFSEDYSKCPQFREAFKSLILDKSHISDVEKLHYLRESLEGGPATKISTFPLTSHSLKISWDLLIKNYENPRLIISEHLDPIVNIKTPTHRDAESLLELISTVTDANLALESSCMSQNVWDFLFVHHISRHLDKATREAWKTSLGSSQDYPRLEKLRPFLTTSARALKCIESLPTAVASTIRPTHSKRRATAH